MTRHCLQLALACTMLLAIGCSGPQANTTGLTEAKLASTLLQGGLVQGVLAHVKTALLRHAGCVEHTLVK